MRFFVWLFRAFVFFSLFAFALNNQHAAAVHWFFGYAWNAPMVIVVLAAFGLGAAFGVLAMTPSWWRQWRLVRRLRPARQDPPPSAPSSPLSSPLSALAPSPDAEPPRPDGL